MDETSLTVPRLSRGEQESSEEFGNEGDFDIDKLILERKSDRSRRNSSGGESRRNSSGGERSPQRPTEEAFQQQAAELKKSKEDHKMRYKYCAPLRNIEEVSEEQLQSEYGSELGFDRKTPKARADSLATRLKATALR